jgi:aminoglycoside phosphotransferase (APT) family kinase protein
MPAPTAPTALAPQIVAWIESATGGTVTAARQIPAGGRLGWFVDVDGTGGSHELFLQAGRGLGDGPSTFRGLEVEAEVYRALRPHRIPVPRVWGVDKALDVLLVDRIPGTVWFHPPATPDERVRVAQDFVRHLAAWHRLGAESLDLQPFGPVKTWRAHQLDQLAASDALMAAAGGGERLDPLVTHAMDWLSANVPDAEGPVVLVQGDTGPGNFLYQDGKVTGIIDWELAHLGDPMDDIAWLSWRTAQHGFTHFPDRMREYEQQSGITVDAGRVRYYRLNAFGRLGPWFGLPSMGRRGAMGLDGGEPLEVNRAADGSALILSTLHRRMRLDATSDALGLDRPPREVEEAPEPAHAGMYDRILDQLRAMVPRIEDRTAASSAKAIARQLKYLREVDRNGELFGTQELDDLGGLLGRTPATLDDGRAALVDAVHDGAVSFEDYVAYHWRRLRRDDHLMRHASGALYERGWPDLR